MSEVHLSESNSSCSPDTPVKPAQGEYWEIVCEPRSACVVVLHTDGQTDRRTDRQTDGRTLAGIVFRLFLRFLRMVRDALAQRGQTQQDRVPLVCSRITKLLVRPVKPVQHAQHSVALIEPGEEHSWI